MSKNDFCVNTEEHGSIWGNLIDWIEANKIARNVNDEFYTNPDKCVRYEKNITDWNGEVYVWMKDYSTGDNLFIKLK